MKLRIISSAPGMANSRMIASRQSRQCPEYHLGHKPEHNAEQKGRGNKNGGFARGAERLTDGRFNRSLVLILCNDTAYKINALGYSEPNFRR